MSGTINRRNSKRKSVARLVRIVVVTACVAAAGTLLSDSGVHADEGADTILFPGPSSSNTKLPKARVLRVDDRGWLEVTRSGRDELGAVTVVTGFDCRAVDSICDALARGEFSETAQHYRDLVAAGMDGLEVRRGLANTLYLDGDLSGAIRAFAWASTDFPRDPDVRVGLGSALAELGIVPQASDELDSLISDPAYRAVALNSLGNAYRSARNLERADEEYERAMAEDPRLVAAHYNHGITLLELDRHAEAAIAFREVTQRVPRLIEGYLNEGLALLQSGQSIRAAVALHRAQDLDPDHPAVLLALGLASQDVGMDAQAVRLLQRSLVHNIDDERIYNMLAASQVRTGQFDQAAETLKRGFALKPRDADEHFQHGLKLFLCDDSDQAGTHFMQAMAMGRRDADVFFAMGQALIQSGRNEAAIRSLEVALRLKPSAPEIHFSLGLALQKSENVQAAMREIKIAIALDPNDADIPQVLMGLQRRTGDFEACAEVGRRLVDLHPEMISTRFDISFCQALAGDLDRAAESLDDAMDHDLEGTGVHKLWRQVGMMAATRVEQPGPYLLLAMIHERRGNWSQAVQAYEKFILVEPEKVWVGRALQHIHALNPERASVPAPGE
jgi:tetratricopeptide (TPR) repeat protein